MNKNSILEKTASVPVFLVCGCTDMRKSINGLTALINEAPDLDPFNDALFVFCNRIKDKLKILQWERNGFWLYYKRLEKGHFKWPQLGEEITMEISTEEFQWLLNGPAIDQKVRRNLTNGRRLI